MSESKATVAKHAAIGSVFIFLAVFLQGINEAILKACNYTVIQVNTIKFGTQTIISIFWWILKKPTSPFIIPDTKHTSQSVEIGPWYGHKSVRLSVWLRAFCVGIELPLFWYGVMRLPLGDFICIHYMEPLLVVFIAAIFLKEALPNPFILIPSVILTFGGIIMVSQPPFLISIIASKNDIEPVNLDGLVATILSALLWAIVVILIRLCVNVHFLQLEMTGSGCIVTMGTLILLIIDSFYKSDKIGDLKLNEWVLGLGWSGLGIGLLTGINGFINYSFWMIGYQIGEATLVGWLEYVQIPISFMYQMFIFGDTPNEYEIVGAVAVGIGGLLPTIEQIYIYLYHEEKENRYRMKIDDVSDLSDMNSSDSDM